MSQTNPVLNGSLRRLKHLKFTSFVWDMELGFVATKIFSICVNSASVERLFSSMGFLHTFRRNKLKHDKVVTMAQFRVDIHQSENEKKRKRESENLKVNNALPIGEKIINLELQNGIERILEDDSQDNYITTIMSSELKLLKQRITELEAKNAELRKKNTVISDLRKKISEFDIERAELKCMIAKTLRMTEKERTRHDAENVKLRVTIKKLRKNNTKEYAELRNRIIKVKWKQILQSALMANDNSSNNNSSNFNLVADQVLMVIHHEKPLVDTLLPEKLITENELPEVISISAINIPVMNQYDQTSLKDKETDVFLNEVYKKKSSSENSEKNENSITNCDDRQKNISVITTSQENNDNDIEFTKSQVIEQKLTKELLSSNISAPSISFEAMKQISSVSHPSSSSLDTMQNLAHLFQNAIRAEHEINVSAEVTTTYDRSYFRNKTLDQYPTLYREFSSENFDYYGITDKTSCSLCKLDHNDEESREGRYKSGSYFIKCEQHEIEITA
ncbi:hypothetical protein C1645_814904 [Glomus cerebriforme]|uniref:HAT C-terminal dimerisation domain-containing protein n=1 Tax=Glomus cerebriforme TaxID=658196 RepID=A0A397TIT5_9GLOM|nr:hypothetical protein C1645_814904 [Glomus cerebriforme]